MWCIRKQRCYSNILAGCLFNRNGLQVLHNPHNVNLHKCWESIGQESFSFFILGESMLDAMKMHWIYSISNNEVCFSGISQTVWFSLHYYLLSPVILCSAEIMVSSCKINKQTNEGSTSYLAIMKKN